MTTSLTDEEMIRQYLPNQSDRCLDILYRRYVNKVYRRCLSMTKNSGLAADFTHDIFLKVFNKLSAFQERSSFSTWLYSIAYNYCADQLRLAKRLKLIPINDNTNQGIPDFVEDQLQEEKLCLVERAMETLSVDEQALLQLKYKDGLSIDEIAKSYQINTSAVKMRLKRSRDKVHLLYTKLSVTF